ncbi:MAG: BMP family ABC transporter substrate-binding protein [Lachnospiraceae bacterium]|nr:BMP family ABC transporter substrate-binding protein [Lachnospiraceae bacterium]
MSDELLTPLQEYEKARKSAQKQYRACVSTGTYPYLPALDDMLPYVDIVSESSLGIVEIPLDLVVGTKTAGRQNAFSNGFLPLLPCNSEFGSKWINLYQSQLDEGIREPIKAYEFMNKFYVQEGNKRVSVLKYVGAASIPGYVTRLIPRRNLSLENKIYYEFLDFYKIAGIHEIWFSKEGSFCRLLQLAGIQTETPWNQDEKVRMKSAYNRFKAIFDDKGGKRLPITAGDALLLYLETFGMHHLERASDMALREEIGRFWQEIELSYQDKAVTLVEEPEADKEKGTAKLLDLLMPSSSPAKLKIAFINAKTPETSNWTYSHELGRLHVEQVLGSRISTTHIDNVNTNAEAMKAIELAISAGNTVIFTTTPQMITASLKAAVLYPDVKILNCSVNTSHKAIRTYYGRMYEAKFLIGAIAATKSEEDDLGYLADYPVYGMMANINAFALGAKMINPRAKIHLEWSTIKGYDPMAALTYKGIGFVSGKDNITPIEENRQFGLYRKTGDQVENLASPIWNWGRYYEKIIRQILKGGWTGGLAKREQALNYYWGMSADVIDVVYSKRTPEGTKHLIALLKKAICRNEFYPFEGILTAQDGTVMCPEGEILTPTEIVTMDWLVDNVIGRIPEPEELTEEARAIVQIHGRNKEGEGTDRPAE